MNLSEVYLYCIVRLDIGVLIALVNQYTTLHFLAYMLSTCYIPFSRRVCTFCCVLCSLIERWIQAYSHVLLLVCTIYYRVAAVDIIILQPGTSWTSSSNASIATCISVDTLHTSMVWSASSYSPMQYHLCCLSSDDLLVSFRHVYKPSQSRFSAHNIFDVLFLQSPLDVIIYHLVS